ncbi:NAD(P)-dependent oxidoreductase [Undibacterium sp. Jales W-56]|uniref:NAD(P)-dependent oxidoreductase n=1 Tax=Undibacterium sp. Jales W-56 TaxID=2897325 RepID=UPI0021CF9B9A|nr:NAD(P)-dependent oxidoreductase [Undibacterium sp. Jales W-56]MCU6434808.1 NAD(P)-dependent oxidoreductase [Undibacterium sp. Jales W-56]
MNKPRIAFLGIGLMGLPMAARLLNSGYALTVWNRTTAKCEPLKKLGAEIAATPSGAIAGPDGSADLIISMLEAGNIVGEMIQQTFVSLRAGQTWIDMSSTQQKEAQEFNIILGNKGVRFVDAPVSGGVIGAEAGTLAIMAGANSADFIKIKPVLDVLGKPTLVGLPGSGQLAKLCNQLIVGGTINIVAEALLLAQAGGADPVAVRQALRGGFAESRILEVHGQRMLDRNFLPGGQVKSQSKDMQNILQAAHSNGLQLPVTEMIAAIYQQLLICQPTADHSAALLALEQKNPGKRLGDQPDILPS